ncbi:NAD(P)-binding protein [Phanerochaete sordida]|uniref:NAD(P)-binding protein n=1 Tax=Phanerochaete sordida TaxID=48140 RepID=A0A9P3GD61_9APHY|nr:NAD(P)-binding protein [Phanerochaete sordida]
MRPPRVWLVTGSSSGFGLAMCKHLLAKGDKVVATLRTPSALAALSAEHTSDALLVCSVDVTRPVDIRAAFRAAIAHFGRVDAVFNNAAANLIGEVEAVPDAAARELMDVNFWGAAAVAREAVRVFRDENPPSAGGLLFTMSSELGLRAFAALGYYCAAKFALEGLMEALVQELDPDWNTKICIVTPGTFRTEVRAKATVVPSHPAYSSVEAPRQAREYFDTTWDPSRPTRIGDVTKAVARIYEVSAMEHIPSRLFLGNDSVASVRSKLQRLAAEADESEQWAQGLLEDV